MENLQPAQKFGAPKIFHSEIIFSGVHLHSQVKIGNFQPARKF